MYQLTFSEQSLSEFDKLAKDDQLQLVSRMSELSAKALKNDDASIPSFCRNGKTCYYRKIEMFRIYLEKMITILYIGIIFCHSIYCLILI
jgi:hypothetical protein